MSPMILRECLVIVTPNANSHIGLLIMLQKVTLGDFVRVRYVQQMINFGSSLFSFRQLAHILEHSIFVKKFP